MGRSTLPADELVLSLLPLPLEPLLEVCARTTRRLVGEVEAGRVVVALLRVAELLERAAGLGRLAALWDRVPGLPTQ